MKKTTINLIEDKKENKTQKGHIHWNLKRHILEVMWHKMVPCDFGQWDRQVERQTSCEMKEQFLKVLYLTTVYVSSTIFKCYVIFG